MSHFFSFDETDCVGKHRLGGSASVRQPFNTGDKTTLIAVHTTPLQITAIAHQDSKEKMTAKASIFRSIVQARKTCRRFQPGNRIPDAVLKDVFESTLVSIRSWLKIGQLHVSRLIMISCFFLLFHSEVTIQFQSTAFPNYFCPIAKP